MNEQLRNALPHRDSPFLRILHIIVAVLVLLQIINSNLTESEALSDFTLTGMVTWFHVVSGFTLIVLGIVMLVWMLKQRGFRYYFFWLTLDFRGIAEDIKKLMSFRLPEAHAGGIAALIQGLGVLALLGVALCGGLWFALSTTLGPLSALAETVLHVHKFLTVFIETYFWAHGVMGLLHIFLTVRSQRKNPITE
ncbi:TPA: cytochrome b/b6 domain-containing protein [Klebsiella aerogenes]|uniref:cytochrome b/b6 domain-containing protein n=1 Tax=Klebsiella aerogenes TaxID=548 RepID=UPI003837CF66|nr:cytochrome b/b6 domain-containing protein [Klebsiella aerogenes]HBY9809085.1 cytochrome b/b6 domain-containing protein [Klebsiella aerogenes]HBY9819219.1 cytochrome b/b6 domain-containing protein [Klebsiella aerogenes]HCD1880641.1 cytochrome b/b6 domain-containing protein [Klebsiella aerogenes]